MSNSISFSNYLEYQDSNPNIRMHKFPIEQFFSNKDMPSQLLMEYSKTIVVKSYEFEKRDAIQEIFGNFGLPPIGSTKKHRLLGVKAKLAAGVTLKTTKSYHHFLIQTLVLHGFDMNL